MSDTQTKEVTEVTPSEGTQNETGIRGALENLRYPRLLATDATLGSMAAIGTDALMTADKPWLPVVAGLLIGVFGRSALAARFNTEREGNMAAVARDAASGADNPRKIQNDHALLAINSPMDERTIVGLTADAIREGRPLARLAGSARNIMERMRSAVPVAPADKTTPYPA